MLDYQRFSLFHLMVSQGWVIWLKGQYGYNCPSLNEDSVQRTWKTELIPSHFVSYTCVRFAWPSTNWSCVSSLENSSWNHDLKIWKGSFLWTNISTRILMPQYNSMSETAIAAEWSKYHKFGSLHSINSFTERANINPPVSPSSILRAIRIALLSFEDIQNSVQASKQ